MIELVSCTDSTGTSCIVDCVDGWSAENGDHSQTTGCEGGTPRLRLERLSPSSLWVTAG